MDVIREWEKVCYIDFESLPGVCCEYVLYSDIIGGIEGRGEKIGERARGLEDGRHEKTP